MTKLTIKSKGIKGSTFEADAASVLRTLDYYAPNKRAFCFYKNNQGWQKMTVATARRYAHVIGGCERVVVAVMPRRFKVKAIKGFPKHRGFFSLAAKRKLPEKRLPYRKAIAIRFYRKLVADGKVPAPVFNQEAIPQAKQITLEESKASAYRAFIIEQARRMGGLEMDILIRNLSKRGDFIDFDARVSQHMTRHRGWSTGMVYRAFHYAGDIANEPHAVTKAWEEVWQEQRKDFLKDVEAYRKSLEVPALPEAEDTLCLGRFDAPALVKLLKAVKRQTFQLPKGFAKEFDKAHLVHIRQYGTGIELVPTDSVGFDAAISEPFVVDGANRHNLEAFQISLVLEQLSNTPTYPAVLDLEKGVVSLEVNFTRNLLTVASAESRYRINLKLISSERREELQNA